ncbi:MAG: hypothetical protein ACRC3G_06800 [Bacteroidales bacterium]
MKRNWFIYYLIALCLVACEKKNGDNTPNPEPTPDTETPNLPNPNPNDKRLYNGITLPAAWPPSSSYTANIYTGMTPFYLTDKPAEINITMGRQLFVDNFLIAETNLTRKWHQAEYHAANPVLAPEKSWEMAGTKGGGFAAPFSDGVWFDETDNKFKMWYMGGGKEHGNGNHVTCYAESADGITWTRPALNYVSGTNIVHRGLKRDSYSVWMDKTETNTSQRMKMFGVAGGAGNWKYHYFTSSDGKAWRVQNESGSVADRSTTFRNPFRGVWVWSLRRNARIDPDNLIRAREYNEAADAATGNRTIVSDLSKFWFGPWLANEPVNINPAYRTEKPAIYNLDAIAYESVLLGTFSIWSGPENDVSSSQNVIKQNQLLLGYSRDGWNWHREDFTPFCPVSTNKSDWNNGNIQSAIGSPIIVGDKLYFYMSGRRLNEQNAEITSTGLATLRRDGFASMEGTGTLTTEKLKFTGEYFYVNADIAGDLQVEILNEKGEPITGFTKDDCIATTGNSTKKLVQWKNNATLAQLKDKTIQIKFYLKDAALYAFWVSPFEDGRSYGYTAGGGAGLSKYGIDL